MGHPLIESNGAPNRDAKKMATTTGEKVNMKILAYVREKYSGNKCGIVCANGIDAMPLIRALSVSTNHSDGAAKYSAHKIYSNG